jgi:hypothetical protein
MALCFVPVVNFASIVYLVALPDQEMVKKLDHILQRLDPDRGRQQ